MYIVKHTQNQNILKGWDKDKNTVLKIYFIYGFAHPALETADTENLKYRARANANTTSFPAHCPVPAGFRCFSSRWRSFWDLSAAVKNEGAHRNDTSLLFLSWASPSQCWGTAEYVCSFQSACSTERITL